MPPDPRSATDPSTRPLARRYARLLTEDVLERDPAQVELIARLDALGDTLRERALASKSSPLGWLFGRRRASRSHAAPRGLYIWGGVGRGKTMLMDLFYETVAVEPRRRVHFHAFMADVHGRIHAYRQRVKAGSARDTDPIPPVAEAIAREAALLCFDEFAVTDITDAMILGRLFTALFARGVTVVATSNVKPDRLYEDGLNRALFLPFLALLQERMDVFELDARTDFRLEKLAGAPVWHVPADAAARRALDNAFHRLTGMRQGEPLTLEVKGHALRVPQAASGVARADFADLCAQAYGASDYLALAQRFHTLMLDDIPVMDFDRRNEARRFIMLIDTLYEAHVKLVATAQAEPDALYAVNHGREAFEFARTVSRLIEMRSQAYLALPHGRADSTGSGDATGLVET